MTAPVQTRAAAQERAIRTFFTQLGIDVSIALATVLLTWVTTADLTDPQTWIALGIAVSKTLISTIAAYVIRLKVAPATEIDGSFNPETESFNITGMIETTTIKGSQIAAGMVDTATLPEVGKRKIGRPIRDDPQA